MREAGIPVEQLILRCVVQRDREVAGRWVAECIDLDLGAVGTDPGVGRATRPPSSREQEAVAAPLLRQFRVGRGA